MKQARKQLLILSKLCKGTAAFSRAKSQRRKGDEEETGLYVFLLKRLSEGRKHQMYNKI